jgi:hypothetical protein
MDENNANGRLFILFYVFSWLVRRIIRTFAAEKCNSKKVAGATGEIWPIRLVT